MLWQLCAATVGVMMRMNKRRDICGSIIIDTAVSSITTVSKV